MFVFDGWSADVTLNGEVFRGKIAAPNKDTVYYARWATGLKLTLDVGTGTLSVGYIYLKEGAKIAEAVKDLVPQGDFGMTFDAWYLGDSPIDENTVMPNADTVLKAQYVETEGISDALGGKDYLRISEDDPTVIYLARRGIEEKTGEYDPDTKIFTFKEGDEVILSGKITGEKFYYFNVGLMKEFSDRSGKKTLEIKERYAATYVDENSTSYNGEVEFDVESGYYVFKGDNDFILRFIFETTGNKTVFILQNMEEAGTYLPTKGNYPMITLDGLGNFTYTFDPDHPTYYDITGEPLLEAGGTYTINEDGAYECVMSFGNTHLEDFLFRIVDDRKFERSDFYGQLAPTLYLNGFGKGIYTDSKNVKHEGTYEVVHTWWMTFDTRDALKTWLIAFDYKGADEDIYYAITQDNYGTVTAAFFGSVPKNEAGGLYIFDNAITIGGETYSDAFIMLLVGKHNETMILVKISDQSLSSGEMVGVYAPMYTGTVTEVDDTYHYQNMADDSQMNFKIAKNGRPGTAEYVTDTGDGTLEKVQIAEGITVDPNTSKATCVVDGKTYQNVSYGYSKGEILEFYTFRLDDDITLYYYRDINVDEKLFTKTSGKFIFDYAYVSEELANPFPARLLLENGTNKAYLAIPMGIGEADYVGEGTYKKVEGTDNEYEYHNLHWASDLLEYFGGDGFQASLDQFIEMYSDFTFKTEGGTTNEVGSFYERDDDMYFDLENFKADGYSNVAEFTLDNGNKLKGEFYRMEIIIVFECNDVEYYLKEDAATKKMINVSEDAGLYYLYTPDDVFFMTFGPESGGEYYDYIVYDGADKVTIVSFDSGFLANTKQGSMEKTNKWTDDFREYTITDETGMIYRLLLGTFESIWGDEYLVYDKYSDAYLGDWYTEDGGKLHGDGYRIHDATYDVDDDGTPEYSGAMVRARFDKTDIQTHAYIEDDKGDVIVFTYTEGEASNSFVFNIVTGDGGMSYLKERKLIFGSFAYWKAGERPGNYIYLDGNGKAELYDVGDKLIGTGTYRQAPEISDVSYRYEDDTNPTAGFYFAIYIESESTGGTYFEYRTYNSDVFGEYDSDDWSHLSVGYYGEITYIDRYGMVYEGYYSVGQNKITLVTHDESGVRFTFYYDQASGYFLLA